ncbi:MAG: ABC transporter permease [Erysipelotrichaceae bacterium]
MSVIIEMFPIALMLSTPLIIAALGGFFSERSGVVNIALEGSMTVGGFVGAACLYIFSEAGIFGNLFWAVLAAIIAGMLFSVLLAFAAIHMQADQTIAGTALNILSIGLTVYICEIIFGAKSTPAFSFSATFQRVTIPVLSDIPIIGDMLFTAMYPTVYLAFFLVIAVWFVAYKTPFGLRLRSCGEFPQASASMGVNVIKMRWIGVLLSGAFSGLAGAILVLTTSTYFQATSIHGLGFIAIATLIFGKWKPWGVLGAGLFFGFAQTLGYYSSSIEILSKLPVEFFSLFPYAMTIIALIIFSGKSVGPKASGQIYDAGKR